MHRDSSESTPGDPLGPEIAPDSVRDAYDAVATDYAERIATELDHKPFDRAYLDRFADLVRGRGPVVELGCGTGHVAGYLAGRGLDVAGLDLSPAMVGEARRLFPSIPFDVGDMLDLPYEDGSLAGAVSFYSIIHFEDGQLDRSFGEMHRVLRPAGVACIAFHIGDERLHRDEFWGHEVSLDVRFLQPDAVASRLDRAGLDVTEIIERDPYAPEVEYQSRRAYLRVQRRA